MEIKTKAQLTPRCVFMPIAILLWWASSACAEDEADLAAMMEKAQQYTQPGKQHQLLQRFVGEWKTTTKITAVGVPDGPGEEGIAKFSWMMDGRWLQSNNQGQFLGKPIQSFSVMGYDNFKQSFVATSVSSFDTAMNRAEGDMDPGGKALIMYGTVDEYLTGEHDKMVKVVWRFISDDEMTMELHDLPIGEKNTKVVEVHYQRQE